MTNEDRLVKTVDLWMAERELTVEDLAERSGLTDDRVEAIAVGRWTPSPRERKQIAEALELDVTNVSWGHTMDPRNVHYRRFGLRDQ